MKKKVKITPAKTAPVYQHLKELRNVIFVSLISLVVVSVISSIFFEEIVDFLYTPFTNIEGLKTEDTLFANMVFEGFLTKIKVSIMTGLIFSSPVITFMIIRFVLPALTTKEKRVLFTTLFVSFALILLGFYYGYFYILPITIRFFTKNDFLPQNVSLLLSYQKNIMYIFRFILMVYAEFSFSGGPGSTYGIKCC